MCLRSTFDSIKKLKPNQRMFFITSTISCLLSVYLALYLVPEIIMGIIVSIVTIFFMILYLSKFFMNEKKWLCGELILAILMLVLVLHLPSYYLASSRVTYRKGYLLDDKVIKIDEFLLGWLFPKGQLSLYLDNNDSIGPHTQVGQLINNTLQLFYFLYYIIPYITMYIICLANCGKEMIFRYLNKGQKSPTYEKRWNNTYFLFSVYTFTYINVFFINTFVPASSPRKYLENEYMHKLTMSGFARFLNNTCKDDRSANSFPSGHVAETMCIAFAFFGMKKKLEGFILLFCSSMIALATLFLRYHYFSDLLCALSLSGYSFLVNYYLGYRYYLKEIQKIGKSGIIEIKISNSDSIIGGNQEGNQHIKLDEETGQKN